METESMEPADILAWTRKAIREHSGSDPDKWFYANRFVFARLHLDERKTKTSIKRRLLEADTPCYVCGQPFGTKTGVHIHRLDGGRGYSDENCVLVHSECHAHVHAERSHSTAAGGSRDPSPRVDGVLTKLSKRYDDMPFLYWWDIAPGLAERLDDYEVVRLVKKDTGESCGLSPGVLRGFLTDDRRTSRGSGNWGVKVLVGRAEELAFEPGGKGGDWSFLPVVWSCDGED